jgi:uncharacterized damage-inducible protein DinB
LSIRNALGFAILAAIALLLAAVPARAQSTALEGIRGEFKAVSGSVMKAANKAPETLYSYQPTPEVYTMRKMLLHIAGASYSMCASFQDQAGQGPKVDANKMASKQEVLETLTAAFSYCDATMAKATDATLAEVVTAPSGTKRPKSYYASHLIAHTSLHYGNIVTYMRLNKMSPGD